MNIVAWNCCGIGGPRKRQLLISLLQSTRTNLIFLAETKCSLSKSKRYLPQMPLPNYDFVPSRGRSGELWILWDNNTKLEVNSKSRNVIHAVVTQPDKSKWDLICVYGDPAHTKNEEVWRRILGITMEGKSVCVLGDFNAILSEEDKHGGDPILNSNSRKFRRFMFEAQLIDLGFKGPAYTWTNKQNSSHAIYKRLDRVLANVQWTQSHPEATVHHLPRIHSDHSPILLRTRRHTRSTKKFKMESWWFMEEGFQEVWLHAWNQSESLSWQQRVKQMEVSITRWARELGTPQNRIKKAQEALGALQMLHPNEQDMWLEEALLVEIDEAERELEAYWRQRSKVQWTCEGDRNTHFFHTVATNGKRHNQVQALKTEQGVVITDEKEIRKAFVDFFKSLYCSDGQTDRHSPTEFFNNAAQ